MRKLLTRSTEVTQLHEITDLLGIRVVTMNLDSIASIVARIEAAFRVNGHKSGLRTNPAGYRTRHVVCAIPSDTTPRWFEIQVRTVGEHAWSELQHPIYKGAAADEDTIQTLVKIATLYHEAESLAAGLRRRFHAGQGL
jgi:ppGpp synthetase/RelA/SpoT-type nucleotidyltranferase